GRARQAFGRGVQPPVLLSLGRLVFWSRRPNRFDPPHRLQRTTFAIGFFDLLSLSTLVAGLTNTITNSAPVCHAICRHR
ncbi:MAG: hypothetical protein Q6353_003410, partial [Candidatus Sigynarchaeum springense]